jgi:hypothetical protein
MDSMNRLVHGPLTRFADWPSTDVPRVAAGVYTIWHGSEFLYVGMAGRALTKEALRARNKDTGLWVRLNSHASGRRSGDQFCVYVCDRLVLPTLSRDDILGVSQGSRSLDDATQAFIRARLSFRWACTADGAAAQSLEAVFRRGETAVGFPYLNPQRLKGHPARVTPSLRRDRRLQPSSNRVLS